MIKKHLQKRDLKKERKMLKWLIFIIFIVMVSGLSLFLFCALKISSRCTREEERRDVYKNIGNNNRI